ncbi:class II aldolase/adducin family protein [Bacteroidota bacterium]
MNKDIKDGLDELVRISNFYGRDKQYVIAGGGNTSFKTDDRIWVKASGYPLASISIEGLAELDRKKLEVISSKSYSGDSLTRENEIKTDLNAACISEGKRPSVETSLHNLIDYRFVVHLHPTLVNGLLCADKAEVILKDIFGKEVISIPYTDPGYLLFKRIEKDHDTEPRSICGRK